MVWSFAKWSVEGNPAKAWSLGMPKIICPRKTRKNTEKHGSEEGASEDGAGDFEHEGREEREVAGKGCSDNSDFLGTSWS
jgi:hypothetical protein